MFILLVLNEKMFSGYTTGIVAGYIRITKFFFRDSLTKGRNNPSDKFALQSQGSNDIVVLDIYFQLKAKLYKVETPVLVPSNEEFLLPTSDMDKSADSRGRFSISLCNKYI